MNFVISSLASAVLPLVSRRSKLLTMKIITDIGILLCYTTAIPQLSAELRCHVAVGVNTKLFPQKLCAFRMQKNSCYLLLDHFLHGSQFCAVFLEILVISLKCYST